MRTVCKSKQTVGNIIMICSSFVVLLLMAHVFSQPTHSVERRAFNQPVDKLPSISKDMNRIKSNENKNTEFVIDDDNDIGNNRDEINIGYDGHLDPESKVFTPKDRHVWTSPPLNILLSRGQIAAITKVLPPSGNLFVWGLGNDSPFWHDSTKGKVIFIEPEGLWLQNITAKYPFLEAFQVNYTTLLFETFDEYINNRTIWSDLDLLSQLPPVVTQTPWDVILVDAPSGFEADQPGRYQSIYTSSLIAQNGTHIFVDDFDRRVEREFSLKMLGTPVEVVSRPTVENVTKASQLAHFIHTG